MNRLVVVVLCLIAGFVVFAVCGYFATQLLSSNSHDRDVEAAMTAMFVAGPIGALIGAVVAARRSGRRRPGRNE